jgi:hypothetical protein
MNRVVAASCAIIFLSVGVAIAADPPEQKEGLWSIHRQVVDNPGNNKTESSQTICRSHAYDAHIRESAKNMKGCTKQNASFEGGKYVMESHCVVGGTTVDTKGTATYQGDSVSHSEVHATYSPALAGVSEMTMILDQKYIGSCPAGVQPGDMTSSDGNVTHLWKH